MRWKGVLWVLMVVALLTVVAGAQAQAGAWQQHFVQPGDTWAALAWRFGVSQVEIKAANPHMNPYRQPAIGAMVLLPETGVERPGQPVRAGDVGLLQTAVRHNTSPWLLALQNGVAHPYRPLFYRPIFITGGTEPPRDLPAGFDSLELSQSPAHPGQALAFRAQTSRPLAITATLGELDFDSFGDGRHLVGLIGAGAFYGDGEPELTIRQEGLPLWSQPIRFADREWTYQQITLTGSAAAIDQESIAAERARLFELWSQRTPTPLWSAPFQLPITDYLEITSHYGARRSYNGGPYRSYHEGVDFAAYGGTDVYAAAAGNVVLAEFLYVRGGAVILDHGLGVYTGYYHMSSIAVAPGQAVQPGQLIGAVGTTGLSTGNHLHWDLLVNETWVDAAVWLEQDMACWILEGLGRECQE